jgi:hypothetical protein
MRRLRSAVAICSAIAATSLASAGDAIAFDCQGPVRPTADGATALAQSCGSVDPDLGARDAAKRVLGVEADQLGIDAGRLQIIDTDRSPGGRVVRFQQLFDDVPVFDGQTVVSLGDGNRVDMVVGSGAESAPADLNPSLTRAGALARAAGAVAGGADTRLPPTARLVVYPDGDRSRLAWHAVVATADPVADWNLIIDADTGAILGSWNGIDTVTGTGIVFSPNPVQRTGNTSLRDLNNTDSGAFDSARSSVSLTNLAPAVNTLRGDFADLTGGGIIDGPLPYTPGTANEPSRAYNYSRADNRFEEANAYYAITEVQKLIQALGFTSANNRSIPVDVHFDSDDNSFYSSTDGGLHFGDGGVDDAEDADVVIHEYGHSVQDNQVPGWGPGGDTEQGAIGEGFGDLLAVMFYMGTGDPAYEASVRRYCVMEWDATAYNPVTAQNPGSGCLRWINGMDESTGADIGAYSGAPTEVHDDGRYWSAAMTCVFDGMGGDTAARDNLLKLVLDSQTRLVPTTADTAFEDQVASMLVSDTNLFGGSHRSLIGDCARSRNIADLDTTAPETSIGKHPKNKTTKKRAKFTFTANETATFQCSVDDKPFASCSSPFSVKVKKRGKHTFAVQAADAAGNVETTPATDSWKLKKKRKRHHHHH